jgi:Na+-transporting NADH:ubiquinone oxidoreductase subunit D
MNIISKMQILKRMTEKEPLLSKKNLKLIKDPVNENNPITVQILGICSALAVTVKMKPAFVMAISLMAVLCASNVVYALVRNYIPPRIRIIVQLTIIATMVILVDEILKAYVYEVSKQLSVFVGLIITNCILMGRLEAFAMANKPWPSFMDALGNGAGYGLILIIVSFIRELLGSGTVWGYPVMEKIGVYNTGYVNNGFITLPPFALILLGIIIWVQRSRVRKLIETH